jgi:hypothetical protein
MSAPGTDSYVEQGNTQSEYVQQDSAPGAPPESIVSNAPMEQSNESHPLAGTTVYPFKDNQLFENSPVNNNFSNSNRHNFEIDYEIAKRNKENRKSQGISRNISELFMGLDFIRTQLFHDPFFTKKRVYSGVLFVGFIIAIIVLIAVIIICVVGHKNNSKYNTNKYGMQRTYTQYVLWQPFDPSLNGDNPKGITPGQSRWQVVTFPEPKNGDCIISYSAICQGSIIGGTNTGILVDGKSYIDKPLVYVSNCSAVSPNSCVVTVSNPTESAEDYPYGLYVTATYTPLKAFNGNGTQYANNLKLNETYKTYQYMLLSKVAATNQPEESSIAFFAPSNYTPPKS